MKTYKLRLSAKIFLTVICLFSIAIGIDVLSDKSSPFLLRLLSSPLIVFSILGIYVFNKYKIIIDEDKIKVTPLFLPNTGTLLWQDVSKLTSFYFLFPETGMIHLIPKLGSGERMVRVLIGGLPIEAIRDILSCLPQDTKIYLYPYLKKMLERKPDSKRKIIIITILLIIMVVAGFLISWFFWK